jgi:hypothetical protein
MGGAIRWTSWALPLLIVANVSASSLGVLRRWPRINRVFPFVSIGVALVIIVALIYQAIYR